MRVVLSNNGEVCPFTDQKGITEIFVEKGFIQMWRGEMCVSTFALSEFSEQLSLEILEEGE